MTPRREKFGGEPLKTTKFVFLAAATLRGQIGALKVAGSNPFTAQMRPDEDQQASLFRNLFFKTDVWKKKELYGIQED